jgi:ferritin-like metal-binding protein YciE
MELESLRDLFVDELKDLYSAENQIIESTAEDDQDRLLDGKRH